VGDMIDCMMRVILEVYATHQAFKVIEKRMGKWRLTSCTIKITRKRQTQGRKRVWFPITPPAPRFDLDSVAHLHGLPVSGVISERVQAERGCTADLTVVRDRHCNRGERASQYSRFALGDEEHQEGAPAPTRSRGGARVAGLGVLAGPELPHRSECSATACTLF
jgi:hypothetical protein